MSSGEVMCILLVGAGEEVDEEEDAEDLAKFREMLAQHANPERATAKGIAEEDEAKRMRK